ncbi:MAG: hypothetical protein IPG45_12065 [Deltaproteobacteria bacterium]|nr:hypothetical protein [Deltaproteobacteria bacterium]
MNLLLVRAGPPSPLCRHFVEGAPGAGATLEIVEAPAQRRSWPLALAQLGARLLSARPDAALIQVGPGAEPFPAALAAARVPYSLVFGEAPFSAETNPLTRESWRAAARGARVNLAEDEAQAQQWAEALELPEVLAFGPRLDLGPWPLADRLEARRALGLPIEAQYLGLIADLEPPLRLDLLALAHRKVPGAGLLIAGTGSLTTMIEAMRVATRPSSPVLPLGPRSPTHNLAVGLAADVHLILDGDAARPEALAAAALGRRQVNLHEASATRLARLYPEQRTVFLAEPSEASLSSAISRALEEERQQGPLPGAAVEATRRALDESTLGRRLVSLVCASSW